MTWAELFPFPEVTAKYGHGARNRYFPALCRDCAISHFGLRCIRNILYFQSKRELFSPLANCCQSVGSKSAVLRCGSRHEADHVSIWHCCFLPRVHGSTEEGEGSEKSVRKRMVGGGKSQYLLVFLREEDVHQKQRLGSANAAYTHTHTHTHTRDDLCLEWQLCSFRTHDRLCVHLCAGACVCVCVCVT